MTDASYYVPSPDDATHLLDGHEPVTGVRPAHQIMHEIRSHDREAFASGRSRFFCPQIDRATMEEHGLYLVHNIPRDIYDFCGDLLVDGSRIAPLPT